MIEDRIEDQGQGGPVRVVRLQIPNHQLSEELFGPGVAVPWCKVVFRHMLPAPAEASLHGVLKHGLAMVFAEPAAADDEPNGLLVPWDQVAYVNFHHG